MNDSLFISVVIATFNRSALLRRLLTQLAEQTLSPSHFEVIVVDDGSEEPVAAVMSGSAFPYSLRIERQTNRGAAIARHRGIRAARGDIVVVIDDDMQVAADFLTLHQNHHRAGDRVAVLGRIALDPAVTAMPLFERWHQHQLDVMAEHFLAGERRPSGLNLYTGNVSFRRADYLSAGGFDASLEHSEDADLGLRLEKLGVRFVFDDAARVLHSSDHSVLDRWRRRAESYGVFDHRISRKHPDRPDADPWKYLFSLNPLASALLAGAVAWPRLAARAGGVAYWFADRFDRAGWPTVAMSGTTLAFGLDYFRGLRHELGSRRAATLDLGRFLIRRRIAAEPEGPLAKWGSTLHDIRSDQEAMRLYEARYGHRSPSRGSLAHDLVERVGLQVLAAHRVSRALDELGHPVAAKVAARLLRHLYGSDLHWKAYFAPGVLVVHGMGMAISHGASVGPGCILFQNVTLGLARDPVTHRVGAPALESGVHVGPGCTLTGPITVGANSKLAPGVVLTHSVPPNTVIDAPPSAQRERRPARPSEGPAEARS